MDLLKAETDATPSHDGKVEVTVIATTSEDGLKISLAEKPVGRRRFFQGRTGLCGWGREYYRCCFPSAHWGCCQRRTDDIAVYRHSLHGNLCFVRPGLLPNVTRPIEQISAATEQMRELEPDSHCQSDTQDEFGMLAGNVNSLYQTLLSTIQTLEREIEKVEAADILKSNFLRAASHELKTPVP